MAEAEGSCPLSKELFVCPSLEGVSPLHLQNILFAPAVGIGGGRQGANHTYDLLCQRDTAPANITCQRNSSFSTFLGCVINSSLNDLKCEIYQPSVIFSVIYSIWCNPPNFGVEIKLVEFTFHSYFLLYSPGACLVFVFSMCI